MKKLRILINDSDFVFTANCCKALSASKAIEVIGVEYDGINGLKRIQSTKPDVVIIDIQLPGMDGIAVLRESRLMKEPPVFIFCTCFYSDFCVLTAQQNGAAYVLYKPLDYHSLSDIITGCYKSVHSAEHLQKQTASKREIKVNEAYQIRSMLFDMGMPPRYVGCMYLVESILLASENRMLLCNLSKGLYAEIAIKMNTTATGVERSLRNAISTTYERGRLNKVFNHRPTNKQFLNYLIDRLGEGSILQ